MRSASQERKHILACHWFIERGIVEKENGEERERLKCKTKYVLQFLTTQSILFGPTFQRFSFMLLNEAVKCFNEL